MPPRDFRYRPQPLIMPAITAMLSTSLYAGPDCRSSVTWLTSRGHFEFAAPSVGDEYYTLRVREPQPRYRASSTSPDYLCWRRSRGGFFSPSRRHFAMIAEISSRYRLYCAPAACRLHRLISDALPRFQLRHIRLKDIDNTSVNICFNGVSLKVVSNAAGGRAIRAKFPRRHLCARARYFRVTARIETVYNAGFHLLSTTALNEFSAQRISLRCHHALLRLRMTGDRAFRRCGRGGAEPGYWRCAFCA